MNEEVEKAFSMMEVMEIYEEFEQVYEVSLDKNLKEKEQTRGERG